MLRNLSYMLSVIACVSLLPGVAASQNFGMTPSHVYGMWTNINNALVAAAGIVSGTPAASEAVAAIKPRSYSGKKPADVLKRVMTVHAKLNRLRARSKLKPAKTQPRKESGKITPSDVYLNSGHVQDGLVDWIVRNTTADQLVSQFYTRRDFSGKTPSDAFAMVDLAARRIDHVMAGG